MQIKIEVRNVYGEQKFYPACTTGKMFAQIAGTKTLTAEKCELIKALGYEFVAFTPELAV
jgi:hypothetical protein